MADISALAHQILNRIALGRSVTFEYAQQFVEMQHDLLDLAITSQLLPSELYGSLEPLRAKATGYVQEYLPCVEARFSHQLDAEDCSPSLNCSVQLASAIFDAFAFAGGFSVPMSISNGIGVLFSTDQTNPLPQASYAKDQALNFFWEVLRYFSPVLAFPYWSTRPVCAGTTADATAELSLAG